MTKPLTPTEICKRSRQYNEKISLNNASDILRLFVKEGIAECLNEDAKVGRLYQLIGEGIEMRDALLKE